MLSPTAKLRFIERRIPPITMSNVDLEAIPVGRSIKILQQWWEDPTVPLRAPNDYYGEWKDVPLEME